MTRSIEEIERELAEAKRQAQLEKEAVAATVPPEWRYEIKPVESRDSFDRLFDDTMRLYVISGTCVNRAEAEAVGNHVSPNGQMRYLYNTVTEKLVCSVGGGTIYVSNPWRPTLRDYQAETMEKLSLFVTKNPLGGDITRIVEAHREATKSI
jgi:hypothetical protein